MEKLFKNKCSAGGYWTIFCLKVEGREAVEECTACHAKTSFIWNDQNKKAIAEVEKNSEKLEAALPELKNLKNRGDKVSL